MWDTIPALKKLPAGVREPVAERWSDFCDNGGGDKKGL